MENNFESKITVPIVVNSEEINESAQNQFMQHLSGGSIFDAIEIKDRLNLTDEFINSPEVQELAQNQFLKYLSEGSIFATIKTKI